MKYTSMASGIFVNRPNRFIAHVLIQGKEETVHVKNTGRCQELLIPGTQVYLQLSQNQNRKTNWDLVGVKKGDRIINMDAQAPNQAVKEWLEHGGFIPEVTKIIPEYTYGQSRIDFYVETKKRKILIEVKGVTLEENGVVRFPDAPSERAVKHVKELQGALANGYESYILFVVQMKNVRYFTPNTDTHPAFSTALREAAQAGVKILAYDCNVTPDQISIRFPVPVVLNNPILYEMGAPLVKWYREHKRDLPWRMQADPYRIWVSEIMLQQTRVETVKVYYERFLQELPTIQDLAEVPEDKLLKLWEGLGYYNRVRNMKKAAMQIMIDYNGIFPGTFEEIRSLKGIGSYTAGAVSSIAFGIPKPAVDGNVLRVITRLTGNTADIMKQSTKTEIENSLEEMIFKDAAGDFNQALIELGAMICVPNGRPKCKECPLCSLCIANKEDLTLELPVKTKTKARRIEEKTVLVFRDGENIAITKRKSSGLLAGLYELPNLQSHLSKDEVTKYCKSIGLMPVHIKELPNAKHIFSHVEWHMKGYLIIVDELEKTNKKDFLFVSPVRIQKEYPIPSAFEAYMSILHA